MTETDAPGPRPADRFLTPTRWLGYVEGVSMLALLLVAMPLKYAFDRPGAVSVVGMIHGVLFLLYAGAIVALFAAGSLRWRAMVIGLVAAVIPLGPWLLADSVHPPSGGPARPSSSSQPGAGSVQP